MAGLTTDAKTFKLMELRDVKIKKLGAGDVPTGALVDIPGALKLSIAPKIDTKKLYGDSELKDVYSKTLEIELDVECSLFSLDALQLIMGGAVSAEGSGAVAGAKTFTVSTNFAVGDTLTVGGVTLTATASTTDNNEFAVGAASANTVANIKTALDANATVASIYNVTVSTTTFTLTERVAGGGNTPADATKTGTGVVTSGTATTSVPPTNATSYVYSLLSTNSTPPYFMIEGQWTYVNSEAEDAHVKLFKVKATDAPSFEINDASGNFGTVKFKALALPTSDPSHAGRWFDAKINETAAPIA